MKQPLIEPNSNSTSNIAFSMITTTRQRFVFPVISQIMSRSTHWPLLLGLGVLLLGMMITVSSAIAPSPIPTIHSLSFSSLLTIWPSLQWLDPDQLTDCLAQSGAWGPMLYILLLILSVVVSQIPGAPLAVAAGAVWGPLAAGTYTVIGGFGGALIAYGLGRWVGPAIIQRITGKKLFFTKQCGTAYLGGLIFATRLLPLLSFDLVSYGAGMVRLSFPVYALATFLGMLPSTFLLTYMGGSIHLGGGAIALFSMILVILFVGIPALLHRLDCLDMQKFVRWE